jgi:hypothetical protein
MGLFTKLKTKNEEEKHFLVFFACPKEHSWLKPASIFLQGRI